MKVLCVTWSPWSLRMDELAEDLGATRWDCSVLFRVKVLAPFRYFLMAIQTLAKFLFERPNVLVVQNPPIFLPLTALFYSTFCSCKLIVDHHCVWSVKTIRLPALARLVGTVEKFVVTHVRCNLSPHVVWLDVFERLLLGETCRY